MTPPRFGSPEPFDVIDGRHLDGTWIEVTFDERRRYRKTALVWAYEAETPGIVQTPEGEMEFKAGDYIVTDDPPTHAWPVRREVFERTHEEVPE